MFEPRCQRIKKVSVWNFLLRFLLPRFIYIAAYFFSGAATKTKWQSVWNSCQIPAINFEFSVEIWRGLSSERPPAALRSTGYCKNSHFLQGVFVYTLWETRKKKQRIRSFYQSVDFSCFCELSEVRRYQNFSNSGLWFGIFWSNLSNFVAILFYFLLIFTLFYTNIS